AVPRADGGGAGGVAAADPRQHARQRHPRLRPRQARRQPGTLARGVADRLLRPPGGVAGRPRGVAQPAGRAPRADAHARPAAGAAAGVPARGAVAAPLPGLVARRDRRAPRPQPGRRRLAAAPRVAAAPRPPETGDRRSPLAGVTAPRGATEPWSPTAIPTT